MYYKNMNSAKHAFRYCQKHSSYFLTGIWSWKFLGSFLHLLWSCSKIWFYILYNQLPNKNHYVIVQPNGIQKEWTSWGMRWMMSIVVHSANDSSDGGQWRRSNVTLGWKLTIAEKKETKNRESALKGRLLLLHCHRDYKCRESSSWWTQATCNCWWVYLLNISFYSYFHMIAYNVCHN